MTPAWVTAFLDFAPESYDAGVRFWSELTGFEVSASRGEHGEFATLVPADGDAFLKVQRLASGSDRIHLDLHVTDPVAAADHAETLGATRVADHDYVVMRSPGGFVFCLVGHPGGTTPPTERVHAGGHASLLDQVCIDVPAPAYDAECAFWSDLTGRELRDSPTHQEFRRLLRPERQHLELLVQRLDDDEGEVRAHLDWSTSDREAEVARHERIGARVVGEHGHWTVLADPLGREYCVTDRRRSTPVRG